MHVTEAEAIAAARSTRGTSVTSCSGAPFPTRSASIQEPESNKGGGVSQQAIDLPNFGSLGGPLLLEEKRFPTATVDALKARGHTVRETSMTSGLQAITRGEAHGRTLWFGGADPRREGIVMGY